VGYGFAFRNCPSGRHVAYKQGSRSPHEGDLEFISMDVHRGCGKRVGQRLGTRRHAPHKGRPGHPATGGGGHS
jgi:hypothetical protein